MMLMTLCLVALVQPPMEHESDRIREEIKSKWGVLMTKPDTAKELRIKQTVYSSGIISSRNIAALQIVNAANKGANLPEIILAQRKPIKLENHIVLRASNNNTELDFKGSFRDIIQDRVFELNEHAFVTNKEIKRYSKLNDQRGLAQFEDKGSPVLFSKYLEFQISHFLVGLEHASSYPTFLAKLEFQRNLKSVTGINTSAKGKTEKFIFSPEADFGVTFSESIDFNSKIVFEAKYDRLKGIVLPIKWSIKLYENNELLTHREYALDSFESGGQTLKAKAMDYPFDTEIVDRKNDIEKYGRVVDDGTIIPVDRADRYKPIDTLISKNRTTLRYRLLAIALATMGVVGFVYFYTRSRRAAKQNAMQTR